MGERDDVPAWFRTAHQRLTAVRDRSGLDESENRDDPETVQSMPMVLRVPKSSPPERIALLEAAGASVVACCLDERAGGDTAFAAALQRWYGLRIRKIARRARAGKWDRVQSIPGVTVEVRGCAVRAFAPGPVTAVPPEIGKLQIEGTDVPAGEAADTADGPHAAVFVDAGLGMTVGKAAAQVGHATMLLAAELTAEQAWEWAQAGFECVVREVPHNDFASVVGGIRAGAIGAFVADAGYTEVTPGSVTACAVWRG